MLQTKPTKPLSALSVAMIGNAIFSGFSGLFFLLHAKPASTFSGIPSGLLLVVGVLLLSYALMLLLGSASQIILIARLAVGLDWLWVISSAVAVIPGLLSITNGGRLVIAVLALIVAGFATAQQHGLRQFHAK